MQTELICYSKDRAKGNHQEMSVFHLTRLYIGITSVWSLAFGRTEWAIATSKQAFPLLVSEE